MNNGRCHLQMHSPSGRQGILLCGSGQLWGRRYMIRPGELSPESRSWVKRSSIISSKTGWADYGLQHTLTEFISATGIRGSGVIGLPTRPGPVLCRETNSATSLRIAGEVSGLLLWERGCAGMMRLLTDSSGFLPTGCQVPSFSRYSKTRPAIFGFPPQTDWYHSTRIQAHIIYTPWPMGC